MKLAAALPIAVAALALAPAAGALIPIQPGDTTLVYPTRLACTIDKAGSSGAVLHCFRGTKTGTPVVGSYQVSLGRTSVAVEKIGSNGKRTAVFKRAEPKKAKRVKLVPSYSRSGTLFAFQYGDIPFAIGGTNIFCVLAAKPNGLICEPAANAKVSATIVNSYGFVISMKAITVTQATDAKGHAKAVFTKNF